jgi:hypothetical protein
MVARCDRIYVACRLYAYRAGYYLRVLCRKFAVYHQTVASCVVGEYGVLSDSQAREAAYIRIGKIMRSKHPAAVICNVAGDFAAFNIYSATSKETAAVVIGSVIGNCTVIHIYSATGSMNTAAITGGSVVGYCAIVHSKKTLKHNAGGKSYITNPYAAAISCGVTAYYAVIHCKANSRAKATRRHRSYRYTAATVCCIVSYCTAVHPKST